MAAEDSTPDYYEVLQISGNAEPETIHRVYRLLAQRFHPDNQETGDESRFRAVHEAYRVLSDPQSRAGFDVVHQSRRQAKWRLVNEGAKAENEFEVEQLVRLTVLEALYTRRRVEPESPGIFLLDLEELVSRAREHLEFTLWYLVQKGLIQRGDSSRLLITAEGVDHLEQNYIGNQQRRRLRAKNDPVAAS